MLSVANPPDPPCSCKVQALNSDEKGRPSERPSSSPEADPADGPDDAQHPHFSIRDYVLASRSKDVGTNWPFPHQYLQLCVKHGVRDLLPPFEPPDLVRARFSEKCVAAEHLIVCSELEGNQTEVSDAVKHGFSLPTQESVLGSSHQPQNPLSEDKSTVVQAVSSEGKLIHGEAESKVTGHDRTRSIPSSVSQFPGSLQETNTVSESSSEVEVAKPSRLAEKFGDLSEPSTKRCRLIVKFGGAPVPTRTEDIVSNSNLVSDPMASKVCPVCKTFSSTSNTTLNAHIDQCLSVESSAKRVAIKLSQHKVKPGKKRSMEDICATAPHCTLEDLDRRNGTNWALDLASIAQNNEASCTAESKQLRVSPLKATDDEREGAVYVDSNGTKLLILSKFNGARSAAAVDCSGPKKCIKEFKNKSSPFAKKRCFPPKYRKYLKTKVQRKKMSASHLKGEIHKAGKLHVDTHYEEGRVSQASNAPEQIKVGKPGTLGHWICSKRSSLLKRLNSKSSQRKPRNSLDITHHTSMESDQSASCDYFAIGGLQTVCRSSDEILSPLKTRSTDVLSDTVLASSNQGKRSANLREKNSRSIGNSPSTSNGIMLKLSRSTGKCFSSSKSKRVEIHANVVQKSGKFRSLRKTSVDCHPQAHKAKKGSRRSLFTDGPQCTMETIKCNEVVQGVVSKRLRKHRFAEKRHKAVEKLPLELFEGFHNTLGVHGCRSTNSNVTSGMHQSNLSENIVRPENSDTSDHVLPCQHNTMDSNQADAYHHSSEGGEYLTLNHSQLGAACHHAEVTKFDAQIEVPANTDSLVKYPLEKSIGACGSKVVISDNHEATTCDILDSCVSLEHPREPSGANEATIVGSLTKLLGDQGMYCGVIASDVCQDVWQAGQIESSVKDGYCLELPIIEYQADVASIPGSSACLTRPEDEVLELGKSSLVTSRWTSTAEIHNMIVDGEPSGSPVSAASTISHLSVEDLKSKDAEREPSEEPVVIQEKLRPDSRNLGLLVDESMRGTERTNLEKTTQKVKGTASAQEPEKFWDGRLCCCSRRESIPRKSRILRQSAMAGMMLPTKTKQITSPLYIRPVISSSGTYSHSTSAVKAVPIFAIPKPSPDSPTHSISAKASPDFAMRFPTFSSFESASPSCHIQPQNTSSPILRLMGKNLMVMDKEQRPVQQQNQTAPCSSEDTLNGKYMSLLGFSSTCSFSNIDGIRYHPHQSLVGSMLAGQHPSSIQAPVPSPAERMGCFAGTLLQSVATMKPDSHAHQKRLDKKPISLAVYNSERVCTPHERPAPIPIIRAPIPERDIIVIDDSPEHETEPSESMQNPASNMAPPFSGSDIRRVKPFSCYPSQTLFQSRELGRGLKSGFPVSCPRRNANSTKWASTSESSGPLPPRPFVVPSHSAGQLATTLYHSPSFQ